MKKNIIQNQLKRNGMYDFLKILQGIWNEIDALLFQLNLNLKMIIILIVHFDVTFWFN